MRVLDGEQNVVRIFIGESDRYHHTPLSRALLERLRREGFAGATVTHGVAGFGANSVLQIILKKRARSLIFMGQIRDHSTTMMSCCISLHGGGLELVEEVKRLNKPVVLWPNLWWDQGSSGSLDLIRRHVEVAERVVFKSRAERDLLCSMVDVPVDRIRTVPSGVDPCYARVAPLELFKTLYDLDEYVVWIGIVEESKNQLFAIEALRSFEIPVVFVGNLRERDYYDACRKSAPAHFL